MHFIAMWYLLIYFLPIIHLKILGFTNCKRRVWITKIWWYGVVLDTQEVWEHPYMVIEREYICTYEGTNKQFVLAQFTQDISSMPSLILSTVRILSNASMHISLDLMLHVILPRNKAEGVPKWSDELSIIYAQAGLPSRGRSDKTRFFF